MLKKTLTAFTLCLLSLLGSGWENYAAQPSQKMSDAATGTLQKMIVENGSVTLDLDLNGLNGSSSLVARPVTLHFSAAANSFFPVLVFNDLLRAAETGSMSLIPQTTAGAEVNAFGYSTLPAALRASFGQLAIGKMDWDAPIDLVVRDSKSGFVFFNVEGAQYDYDANAQLLSISGGRLLISKDFADALSRPADAGATVGKISIGAAMQPIEVQTLVNGETKSVVMPPLRATAGADAPTLVSGPDVIVGDLPDMAQFGSNGTFVGLGIATTSCNNGNQALNWLALPQTDHPVIPQNLYRMSGGASNNERFEQIGQSWLKHAFAALQGDACNLGCIPGCSSSQLCPGCSDPYSSSLNAGQTGLGSRAWVNPFTGAYPSTANNHTGHTHTGTSHRVTVATSDLDPSQNPGATYFAEAQYVTPHEYSWCQSHPGECNMFNNVSYHQFSVSGGPINFTFSPVGATARTQPAIIGWTGATVHQVEPDPGNDGIWFMGYKVTNPSSGVWHYEYALYNENLDRAIQSFSVPLGSGPNISNIGFHGPPQEPDWANDGTFNNQGYSSQAWTVTQATGSIAWNSETFAQNQNANAIRWGTLYNFRFDANQPPQSVNATVGYFKTGAPMSVQIQAPGVGTTPTPTPTATPTTTPTPTPVVTTNPATNVASFSATLNGSLNPRGSTTTVYFQYGLATGYGSTTAVQTQTGNTVRAISGNISGLSASTTYHFRIVAHKSGGTAFGSDRTFTTLSATGTPVVITSPPTNLASFSAILNGSVDPHGLTTSVHFEYGTTTSYGHMTASQSKTGNTYQNVSASISGLTASTTYHFRIVATNSSGTRYGSDRTFTTLSATGPPVVTTNPATLITSSSATLNGLVDPHGLSTSVYFQYGTTTSYGSTTPSQTKTGSTYQNVSANISGLSAGTTYHFRVVATNTAGTSYGADRTFTTP